MTTNVTKPTHMADRDPGFLVYLLSYRGKLYAISRGDNITPIPDEMNVVRVGTALGSFMTRNQLPLGDLMDELELDAIERIFVKAQVDIYFGGSDSAALYLPAGDTSMGRPRGLRVGLIIVIIALLAAFVIAAITLGPSLLNSVATR